MQKEQTGQTSTAWIQKVFGMGGKTMANPRHQNLGLKQHY
jgi:hypothetical protein